MGKPDPLDMIGTSPCTAHYSGPASQLHLDCSQKNGNPTVSYQKTLAEYIMNYVLLFDYSEDYCSYYVMLLSVFFLLKGV